MRAFLICLVACSSSPELKTSTITSEPTQPPEEADVTTFATATRPPSGPAEQALAQQGYLFDPALDCVARRAGNPPDPKRYRSRLAIGCGTPLYPIDARPIAASLEATVAEMRTKLGANIPVALGIANGVVVIAARLVEIEPVKPEDTVLRGKTLVNILQSDVFVANASGVTRSPIALDHGAFTLPLPAGDADAEMTIVDKREVGPLARIRRGHGGPLFAGKGSVQQRANAARKALGLEPLAIVRSPANCREVPPQVGGEDVTDRASCHQVPDVTDLDVLANDLAYSPLIQTRFTDPRAAFLEIGAIDGGIAFRVTRRFETLTPEDGSARVIAKYRTWWPELPIRANAAELYKPVFDAWTAAPDLTVAPPAAAKALLDKIAAKWTTSKRYWSALVTARELDRAIDDSKPDETPLAIDAAMIQVRDHKGAMRHLIAVILVLP